MPKLLKEVWPLNVNLKFSPALRARTHLSSGFTKNVLYLIQIGVCCSFRELFAFLIFSFFVKFIPLIINGFLNYHCFTETEGTLPRGVRLIFFHRIDFKSEFPSNARTIQKKKIFNPRKSTQAAAILSL